MIASEDIEANGFPWAFADTMPHEVRDRRSGIEPNNPIIINTDFEGGPGVHWIVITQMESSPTTVYMYDPLGSLNARVNSAQEPITGILKSRIEHNLGHRITFHIYPYASQRASTTLCGWFALSIAQLIKEHLREHPRASPSALDKLIIAKFGKSADKKDEQVLAAGFA